MVSIGPNSSEFNKIHKKIILLFIKYRIISFSFKRGFTLKSGIKSPVYFDIRKCLAHPDLVKLIVQLLGNVRPKEDWVLAGVATGALPYAGQLQSLLDIPMCYVRPDGAVKKYGKQKLIEGASVKQKIVYLIEDVATSGKSIERDARIILDAGAILIRARAIFSYDSDKVRKNFDQDQSFSLRVGFMALVTLTEMLPELEKKLNTADYKNILRWRENPETWKP